jgi:hypothetical protein
MKILFYSNCFYQKNLKEDYFDQWSSLKIFQTIIDVKLPRRPIRCEIRSTNRKNSTEYHNPSMKYPKSSHSYDAFGHVKPDSNYFLNRKMSEGTILKWKKNIHKFYCRYTDNHSSALSNKNIHLLKYVRSI